jgi:hypothetical protein
MSLNSSLSSDDSSTQRRQQHTMVRQRQVDPNWATDKSETQGSASRTRPREESTRKSEGPVDQVKQIVFEGRQEAGGQGPGQKYLPDLLPIESTCIWMEL